MRWLENVMHRYTLNKALSLSRKDCHWLFFSHHEYVFFFSHYSNGFQEPISKSYRITQKKRYWVHATDRYGHKRWLALPKDAFATPEELIYIWLKTTDAQHHTRWVQLPQVPSFLLPYQSYWDFPPFPVKEKIYKKKDSYEVIDALKHRKAMGCDVVHSTLATVPRCRVHGTVRFLCFFLCIISIFSHIGIVF